MKVIFQYYVQEDTIYILYKSIKSRVLANIYENLTFQSISFANFTASSFFFGQKFLKEIIPCVLDE